MASLVTALGTALWALLTQLYQRGTSIWFDHGVVYLFRYLVASTRLAYLLRRKGRQFEYVEPQKYNDTVSNCAVCAPAEWDCECPRPKPELEKSEDSVFFYGVNSDGDRLVVSVSRLSTHVAELWLALYTSDGTRYKLPTTLTLDRSAGSCFSAAGLRLQCLAPNRRWRVAFNGLLRQVYCAHADNSVWVSQIWSANSHTLEQPAELSAPLLAESLAQMTTADMLNDINKLMAEMDAYDQPGMMAGELTIEDQTREVFLWGCKVRTRGKILNEEYEENHNFGFLENGDTYHFVHSSAYGGSKGILYGSIYPPSSIMHPIEYGFLKSKGPDSENGLVFIRSGDSVFQVNTTAVAPSMLYDSEDGSSQVRVSAVHLECDSKKGSGFQLFVKRRKRRSHSVIGEFKHKIIHENDVTKVAPLVSDIQERCSKVSDLTGGKGSSLSVLHSISTDLNTFTVPHGFIVTTESYKHFASGEEFQKLIRKIEDSRKRDSTQADLKDVCNSVVTGIENLEVPAEIADEIAQRLSKFNVDTKFAVRSSALGEDSEDMSAAGQMTTLLGLAWKRESTLVISGVVKCWASQFSFTNVNYKRQYGQPLNVPMAVVVQELVDANAAGVMFTCDPLTGSPAKITVTANYGLGESVVSATAEPDTFVLKRAGVTRPVIISTQLGHKSVYTMSSDGDGIVTAPVTEEKARSACISKEDVETLAFIGTQCRPVTTFFRESDCEMIHEFDNGLKSEKEVLCKANMSEVLPGATSPLSYSFIRVGIDTYCRLMLSSWKHFDKAAAKAAELKLSDDGMISAEQLYVYIGRSLHHMREPAELLVKAFATSSMYNLIIIQILAAASGELNNEVFSELSKILLGGDVESAGVPRMIQELGQHAKGLPGEGALLKYEHEGCCKGSPGCGKKELPAWNASKCAYQLSAFQKLILKLVVPQARSAVAARETGKSAIVRVIHQLRLMCHQLAKRMVNEGRLPSPDLLFFLSYEEIGILIRTRAPELVLKAQRRQKVYEQVDKDKYPTILIGVPKPIEKFRKPVEGDFEIKGNPMSQGVAEGRARVVPTFEEAHLIEVRWLHVSMAYHVSSVLKASPICLRLVTMYSLTATLAFSEGLRPLLLTRNKISPDAAVLV
ncbi:hypothetical protein MRX96_022414 [Rhipicephalus microplus]